MNERDPKLEEALRAHLREEPPSALDAKILAAAHQAVASGPRKVGPEATRPQRWWMPLAAAAAIGVIAIGIVQQMPKDAAIDATSVGNAPVQAPAPTAKLAEKVAPPAEQAPAPAVAQSQPPASDAGDRVGNARSAPAAVPPPPPAPAPARDAMVPQKKQKEAEMPRSTEPTAAPAAPPPAAPPPAASPPTASRAAAPPAAAPPAAAPSPAPAPPASTGVLASRENKAVAPSPFPAAPPQPLQKTELASSEAKRDESRDAPTEAAKETADAQMADARKDAATNRQSAAGAAAPAAPPPGAAPASPSPSLDARSAPRQQLSTSASERTRSLESQIGQQAGKVGNEYAALARDPDAWIVRIRKLRDEGNTAQAVRELREFRALVPDAEKKLPADLKSLQP
ncbi:MAG: hypothetical protein U1F54_05510 [Burkholderiales bacterium]